MVNLYPVLKQHIDRNCKSKGGYKDADRMDVNQINKVQRYLIDSLTELERVTPPSPNQQCYQLIAKLNG